MANNYSTGATIVPSDCLAPGGAKRMVEIWESFAEREDDLADWHYGLYLEAQSDGSLYLASDEEWFSEESFIGLVRAAAKESLIVKSFGISIAYFCSKLRADEFGGTYFRATTDGIVMGICTDFFHQASDDQLIAIMDVLESEP